MSPTIESLIPILARLLHCSEASVAELIASGELFKIAAALGSHGGDTALAATQPLYQPIRYRLVQELQHGERDLDELVKNCGENRQTVERILRRYRDRFHRVRNGRRVIVTLKQQPAWE